MSKSIKFVILILAVVAVIFFIFVFSKKEIPIQNEIKIGVILPLTGNVASIGIDVKNAIDLAHRQLGLNGSKVKLMYEDEKCDPKEAISAYNVLTMAGAKIIIGPACSQSTLAIAPLAEKAKVLVVTPVSASDNVSQAGDYIFRNHVRESVEQEKMIEFISSRYKTAATIYDQSSETCIIGEKSFTGDFIKKGGKIVGRQGYPAKATDFRSQLLKIKQAKPDVIQLSVMMPELVAIVQQVKELDIKAQLVSDNVVTDSQFITQAGPLSDGIIFAASQFDKTTNSDFWNLYHQKFSKDPNIFAGQGYDTLMILGQLIKEKCQTGDSTCLKDELYKVKDYPGVSGLTTFDSNGDVVKTVVIKTIKNGQFVPLDQ